MGTAPARLAMLTAMGNPLRRRSDRIESLLVMTFLAALAVGLTLAAALAGIGKTGRALLDRRRSQDWQREWLEVGPRWSRDRR